MPSALRRSKTLRLIYSLGVMHWRCAALSIRGGNAVGRPACYSLGKRGGLDSGLPDTLQDNVSPHRRLNRTTGFTVSNLRFRGPKKNPPAGRRPPGLISGVILANELFRSTTFLAPESQEVGLAISHLVDGEQHGKVAAGAKRVFASVQRVQ